MSDPDGSLTRAQYEILDVVWAHGRQGATVGEIWESVSAHRDVTRTTVLNQVFRLETRGWLLRREGEGGFRFTAAMSRRKTEARLAARFVDDFFGGSASGLVQSLVGSKRLNRQEIHRLRQLLAQERNQSP